MDDSNNSSVCESDYWTDSRSNVKTLKDGRKVKKLIKSNRDSLGLKKLIRVPTKNRKRRQNSAPVRTLDTSTSDEDLLSELVNLHSPLKSSFVSLKRFSFVKKYSKCVLTSLEVGCGHNQSKTLPSITNVPSNLQLPTLVHKDYAGHKQQCLDPLVKQPQSKPKLIKKLTVSDSEVSSRPNAGKQKVLESKDKILPSRTVNQTESSAWLSTFKDFISKTRPTKGENISYTNTPVGLLILPIPNQGNDDSLEELGSATLQTSKIPNVKPEQSGKLDEELNQKLKEVPSHKSSTGSVTEPELPVSKIGSSSVNCNYNANNHLITECRDSPPCTATGSFSFKKSVKLPSQKTRLPRTKRKQTKQRKRRPSLSDLDWLYEEGQVAKETGSGKDSVTVDTLHKQVITQNEISPIVGLAATDQASNSSSLEALSHSIKECDRNRKQRTSDVVTLTDLEKLYSKAKKCVPVTPTLDVQQTPVQFDQVLSTANSDSSGIGSNPKTIVQTEQLSYRGSLYSERERRNIVAYIIHKNAFKLLKGKSFWEDMVSDGICPKRTWQSLKEHFHKKLMRNIKKYMTIEELDKLKKGLSAKSRRSSSLNYYTLKENKLLLSYLLKSHRYKAVGGNNVWIQMEELNVVPGRTWQSLRDHYRRVLVHDLSEMGVSHSVAAALRTYCPSLQHT